MRERCRSGAAAGGRRVDRTKCGDDGFLGSLFLFVGCFGRFRSLYALDLAIFALFFQVSMELPATVSLRYFYIGAWLKIEAIFLGIGL